VLCAWYIIFVQEIVTLVGSWYCTQIVVRSKEEYQVEKRIVSWSTSDSADVRRLSYNTSKSVLKPVCRMELQWNESGGIFLPYLLIVVYCSVKWILFGQDSICLLVYLVEFMHSLFMPSCKS